MDWNNCLEPGETLRWQGRPAPRAFTFRNWKYLFVGVPLLLVASYWLWLSVRGAGESTRIWALMVPSQVWLLGFYLGPGQLLLARLEWERVFYALTDRRLLVRRGLFRARLESFPLTELARFQVRPLGAELATIHLCPAASGPALSLLAVEQFRAVTDLLETALVANGHEVTTRPL